MVCKVYNTCYLWKANIEFSIRIENEPMTTKRGRC